MLKPDHFSYKCPLTISDLETTEDGAHFCAKCSKDIHDLTDCSIDEVIELQRRKGSICGFVRAVSVTSMVGLAACSSSGDESASNEDSNSNPEVEQQATPVKAQPEIIGIPVSPEKEAPEAEEPTNAEDNTVKAEPQPEAPVKVQPEIIERPKLMGKICPPDQLKPEKPEGEALDPNREDSPA